MGVGRPAMRKRLAALGRAAFLCAAAVFASATARADATLHPLWEVHGKHNTVYLLGSIHVLRPADYPLAPAVLDAYGHAKALVMEIDMGEMDQESVQAEMVASAQLPEGKTLPQVLGTVRYAHARQLASQLGVELSTFDGFAPWFVAEAISQLQLAQLGFQPESGVEMYFLGRARTDGKPVTGLETAHDQIAVFESLSMDTQAEYLVSSLEEAGELPKEVDAMVHAWQRGDTQWFAGQLRRVGHLQRHLERRFVLPDGEVDQPVDDEAVAAGRPDHRGMQAGVDRRRDRTDYGRGRTIRRPRWLRAPRRCGCASETNRWRWS